MRTLQSLPPLFLLPAWNGLQPQSFNLHPFAISQKRYSNKPRNPNSTLGESSERQPHHVNTTSGTAGRHVDSQNVSIARPSQRAKQSRNARNTAPWLNISVRSEGEKEKGVRYGRGIREIESVDKGLALIEDNFADRKPLSVLEELFPAEAVKRRLEAGLRKASDLPKLKPPLHDEFERLWSHAENGEHLRRRQEVQQASEEASRRESLAVLVLKRASPALSDADFRRVVPRAKHMEGWRPPGDYLKVIPYRNASSLSFESMYFLVFRNAAYARAYRHRAREMFKIVRKYTPHDITSPIPPLSGTMIDGEDVGQVLQDFALVPAGSETLPLTLMALPYPKALSKLLAAKGYEQITKPRDKTGRSILIWVDGYQPSTQAIKTMLAKDGRDRGIQWSPLRDKGGIVRVQQIRDEHGDRHTEAASDILDETGDALHEERGPQRQCKRWIANFTSETEARRFARVWHLRAYSFPLEVESPQLDEALPLVHTEYLW